MAEFFVHRFKYSHCNKRRKARRDLKAGKIKLVQKLKDGWLYERT